MKNRESLLVSFLSIVLLVLVGVAARHTLNTDRVSFFFTYGFFASCGFFTISIFLILFRLDSRATTFLNLVTLCALLSVLPVGDRIFADVFLISLIALPAFLRLWSWQTQLALSVLGVLSLFIVQSGTVFSFFLVGLAGALSSSMLSVKAGDPVHSESDSLEREVFSVNPQFYTKVWNQFLLLGGLLLLLVFLDVSLRRQYSLDSVLIKLYGLGFLVISGLALRLIERRYFGFANACIMVAVGAVVSLSRLPISNVSSVVAILPLVVLGAVVVTTSWSFVYQISVLWLLFTLDIFVKGLEFDSSESMYSSFFPELVQYSSELAFLSICYPALLIFSFISDNSLRSAFPNQLLKFSKDSYTEGSRTKVFKEMRARIVEVEEPTRRQRFIVGMLIAGILSSIVSSKLLFIIDSSNVWPVVITWAAFSMLWAAVVYMERTSWSVSQFWTLAALISVLVMLWPCSLLFLLPSAGLYWLFWPCCLLFAIGTVPWRSKELVPQLIIFSIIGAELVSRHELGAEGVSVFIISGLLALLFNAKTSRSIKEGEYLIGFPKVLDCSSTPSEALRIFALHVMNLFDANIALCRNENEAPHLLYRDTIVDNITGPWPDTLSLEDGKEIALKDNGAARMYVCNWSPRKFDLGISQVSSLEIKHFLFIKFSGASNIEILLPVSSPIFISIKDSEISVAQTLARITSIKCMQLRSDELKSEISESFEEQEEARELELSSLVHDINNTVQDLTILCDSIIEGGDAHRDSESIKKVKQISAISRTVATVVSDAKRRREIDSSTSLAPSENVNLIHVLVALCDFARVRASQRGIELKTNFDSEAVAWVQVSSREHLETILRNILNNAIAYSDVGKTVEVGLVTSGEEVQVSFIDQGPGLSATECEVIFSAGYRGWDAIQRASGLGIGLSQARVVAEASGGRIEVSSAGKGRGATFTVSLPLAEESGSRGNDQPWALLVDDQPSVVDLYAEIVEGFSLRSDTASSVRQAIQCLERSSAPKLVITDIHMGAENGLDLVRHVRSRYGSSVPVMVISGLPVETVAHQARLAGADDFVSKPIRKASLKTRLESLLLEFDSLAEVGDGPD